MFRKGLIVSTLSALMGVLACGGEHLKGLDQVRLEPNIFATAEVDFCTSPANTTKTRQKFIFVFDKSGSNKAQYQFTPPATFTPLGYGTDSDGAKRYGGAVNFLAQASSNPGIYPALFMAQSSVDVANAFVGVTYDPSVYYALVHFSDAASVTDVGAQILGTSFSNNLPQFTDLVVGEWNKQSYHNPADAGATDYLAFEDKVYTMILNDIAAARNLPDVIQSNYTIIVLTDGAPWVLDGSGNAVLQSTANIVDKVRSIMSLRQGNRSLVAGIQVNTVFYYNQYIDPDAQPRLQVMADEGNGRFFAAGTTPDFSLFTIPDRLVPFKFKGMYATNMNTVWWKDELVADQDMDGLPDEVELAAGTDPTKPDAGGTGAGDLVKYLLRCTATADQRISFSVVPTQGSFKLSIGNPKQTTAAIAFNATAAAVQTAIQALSGYSAVTVTGNVTNGFIVTLNGASSDNLSTVQNSLFGGNPLVAVTVRTGCALNPNDSFSDFPSCTALPIAPGWPGTGIKYADKDKDHLNDFEECLLNSDASNFSTPNSYLPDWLALRSGLSILASSVDHLVDSDSDGMNGFDEVRFNTPVYYPNDHVINLKQIEYNVLLTSSDPTQDCYHVTVSNIATIGANNRIRISIVEASPAVLDTRVKRDAERNLGNDLTVTFTGTDFQ